MKMFQNFFAGANRAAPPLAEMAKGKRRGTRCKPPGISNACKRAKHSACYKRFCTCPCGHPSGK